MGVLLWRRHRCWRGLGSGDGYNGDDGVEEERRQWESSSLAPGMGLLCCPAHLAREEKEMAIIRQTGWPGRCDSVVECQPMNQQVTVQFPTGGMWETASP